MGCTKRVQPYCRLATIIMQTMPSMRRHQRPLLATTDESSEVMGGEYGLRSFGSAGLNHATERRVVRTVCVSRRAFFRRATRGHRDRSTHLWLPGRADGQRDNRQ